MHNKKIIQIKLFSSFDEFENEILMNNLKTGNLEDLKIVVNLRKILWMFMPDISVLEK